MSAAWSDFGLAVGMPHLAPGEKLSEVEFLKTLGAFQWEAIARVLGQPPQEIANDLNERLYGSLIDVELHLGGDPDRFGEGTRIYVKNRISVYAKRFVEGLFVLDEAEIPETTLGGVETRKDLRSLSLPWACMTNAFIARGGGNLKLKVFKPAGIDAIQLPENEPEPAGIGDHVRVQSTGRIEDLGHGGHPLPIPARKSDLIPYPIVPESDLNGAGLVYFARYISIMNYGERLFLGEHLDAPLSSDFNTCLSTEHRKIYYFANAAPSDTVSVSVSASLLPPGSFPAPASVSRHRTPLKLVFRLDLYRSSDKVLMASSLVRKALRVPGAAKHVLLEADRFLERFK